MTSKFTPGPWELCDKGDYGDFDGNSQVILGDDMRLAVVYVNDDETAANATLFGMALEMFEVIESLAFLVDQGMRGNTILAENSPAMIAIREIVARVK